MVFDIIKPNQTVDIVTQLVVVFPLLMLLLAVAHSPSEHVTFLVLTWTIAKIALALPIPNHANGALLTTLIPSQAHALIYLPQHAQPLL